jgi:hypothetical protein
MSAATIPNSEIVSKVSKEIKAKFELEESFVKDIEGIVSMTLDKYTIYTSKPDSDGKKKKASKKNAVGGAPKAPKKSSAYNMYVNAMMSTPEISSLPPKERMGKIGAKWGTESEEEKKKYTDLAIAKNNATAAAASAAASASAAAAAATTTTN